MNSIISKEQAIIIAKKRAIEDRFGLFKEPFLESAVRQKGTDHWVINLLSESPTSDDALSSMRSRYMTITVDKSSGAILAVFTGGGS